MKKAIIGIGIILFFIFASMLFFGRSMEAVHQNITTMFIPATQVIFIFTIAIIMLTIIALKKHESSKSWEQKCDELLQENIKLNNLIMNKNDE